MLALLGVTLLALGVLAFVLGLMAPRRVVLHCDGKAWKLRVLALARTTSVEVREMHGASVEEERRGYRDNVRLVLHADPDVKPTPWVSRGDRSAYAFREAAANIEAYLARGGKGTLDVTFRLSGAPVLWLLTITLVFLGTVVLAIHRSLG